MLRLSRRRRSRNHLRFRTSPPQWILAAPALFTLKGLSNTHTVALLLAAATGTAFCTLFKCDCTIFCLTFFLTFIVIEMSLNKHFLLFFSTFVGNKLFPEKPLPQFVSVQLSVHLFRFAYFCFNVHIRLFSLYPGFWIEFRSLTAQTHKHSPKYTLRNTWFAYFPHSFLFLVVLFWVILIAHRTKFQLTPISLCLSPEVYMLL